MAIFFDYVRELRTAPVPLTRWQKRLVAVLFIVCAVTRLAALSQSLADWDEALFCAGVREYNVAAEQPHAPGYPLFVLAAKAVRPFAGSDFHALRGVTALAAILLFPAAFLFARELRLPFATSVSSATLLMFLPTLWYFGGTALSDVPALCVTLFAAVALLRGARSPRAFLAGMLLAGAAVGIRTTALMVVAVPALAGIATLRSWRVLLGGVAIAATVITASYVGAAAASDDFPRGYLEHVRKNRDHVRDVDSFRNPTRQPLAALVPVFLQQPFRGGRTGKFVYWLAVAGLLSSALRRRVAALLVVGAFLPLALLSWVMLDVTSATRYAVAYLPMYALLAAIGIDELSALARRYQTVAAASITAALVGSFVYWTWPTLRVVATTDAPIVAALKWIDHNVPRTGSKVYIDNNLQLHAEYLLRDRNFTTIWELSEVPEGDFRPGNVYANEAAIDQPDARVFTRAGANRLMTLARPRYSVVAVLPMEKMHRFLDGWYDVEIEELRWWRWMAGSARSRLEPLGGTGELRLRFRVPLDILPRPPVLTVTWNGAVVGRKTLTDSNVEVRYVVASRTGEPNDLTIAVDVTANPKRLGLSGDDRDFGLMLTGYSWRRLP